MKSNTLNFEEKYTVDTSYELSLEDLTLEDEPILNFTNTDYGKSEAFKNIMKASVQSKFVKEDIKHYLQAQNFDKILKKTDLMFVLHSIKDPRKFSDIDSIIEHNNAEAKTRSHVNQFDTIIRMYHLALISDQKEIAASIQNKVMATIKSELPYSRHPFYFEQYLQGAVRLADACNVSSGLRKFFQESIINILKTNPDYLDTKKNHLLRYFLETLATYQLINKEIAETVQEMMKKPEFIPSETLPIIMDHVERGLKIDETLANKLQEMRNKEVSGQYIHLFEVMQSGLTVQQIMKPTEENLAQLIQGRRHIIGTTKQEVSKKIDNWGCGQDYNKVTIVEFKANIDALKTNNDYYGKEGYSYHGTIRPTDIQKIYPRANDFVSSQNRDEYRKFAELSKNGFDNPLLKNQSISNLTSLFNSKLKMDLENKENSNLQNATNQSQS